MERAVRRARQSPADLPCHRAGGSGAQGEPRRTLAPRFPKARRRELPQAYADLQTAGREVHGRVPGCRHHEVSAEGKEVLTWT